MNGLKIYLGHDPREEGALEVAVKSLHKVAPDLTPTILNTERLRAQGLYWRPVDRRGGQDYDLTSNEQASTQFKCTRFLTPLLAQTGWALFVDSDVVFLRDPREMLDSASPRTPLHLVAHEQRVGSDDPRKMDNQTQRPHPFKNWSSVMLFWCEHDVHRRLSLRDISERSAYDLHRFYWLDPEADIGFLERRWNWLVGCGPRPHELGIAHLTLGGPWLPGWQGGGAFDREWLEMRDSRA